VPVLVLVPDLGLAHGLEIELENEDMHEHGF